MTSKPINDAIITTSNILCKINCQKPYQLSFAIGDIIHQLLVDSASSSYINYISMQIGFTASKSTQTCNCSISFLHRTIVHEPVFDPLSNNG